MKGDDSQQRWGVKVDLYVASKNGEDVTQMEGYHGGDSLNDQATKIDAVESRGLVQQIHKWNFWPADVFEETTKAAPTGKLIKGKDRFGTICLGVYRRPVDDPEVTPRRVSAVFEEVRRTAEKRKNLDDSREHIFEGQGERAWDRAQSLAVPTVEKDEGADGCIVAEPIDSDDDFFSPIVPVDLLGASSSSKDKAKSAVKPDMQDLERKDTPKKGNNRKHARSLRRQPRCIAILSTRPAQSQGEEQIRWGECCSRRCACDFRPYSWPRQPLEE
jgi:hypothetical protein